MTLWTMSFGQLPCAGNFPGVTAPNILAMRNGFQVIKIYANGIATKMVKFKSFRDRTDPVFISPSVSEHWATMIFKLAISFIITCASPEPTSIGLMNFIQESSFRFHISIILCAGPARR